MLVDPHVRPWGRLRDLRRALPQGGALAPDAWRRRHAGVVLVLWVHVVVVAGWATVAGGPAHGLVHTAPVLLGAALAAASRLSRGIRMVAATTGLYAASAVLIHLSDGVIEVHFHIFFVLGLVMVYEDWRPVIADAVLVFAHHAVLGVLQPASLYEHAAGQAHPLRWAVVHAGFVAATGMTAVVRWRAAELERIKGDLVLDATGEGIYGLDPDGLITFANRPSERLTGWPAGDLLGRHHHDALRHTMAGAAAFDRDECPTCAVVDAGTGDPVRDHELTRRDGTTVAVELRALPIAPLGARQGTVVSFRDVSQQMELVRQASHDALTGLPNRGLLDDRLAHAVTRGRRGRLLAGCIFLDLDDFKAVNDELGHDVGDRILVETARRCHEAVRPGDTVARYGGDEFVVVCDGLATTDDAVTVARRLLQQFDDPFHVGGLDLWLVPSIGVATGDASSDSASLLHRADAAMYVAKRRGGGVHVADAAPTPDGASSPLELASSARRPDPA